VVSLQPVGATFVDWSIQFLSGQTRYYYAKDNCWIDLVNNPVANDNAHNYKKNHPNGIDQTVEILEKISQQSGELFTFYPYAIKYNTVYNRLNAADKSQIVDYIRDDFQKIFELCSQKTKLIFIDSNPEISLYHIKMRRDGAFLLKEGQNGTAEEIQQEIDDHFFKKSFDHFSSNKWDIRERRALNLRPYNINIGSAADIKINFGLPHLWIDSRSLWTLGDLTLKKIMDYVGLSIDPERFKQWLPVYQQWAHRQLEILDFCHELPHIIDSIVNNWDYQLGDLSFEQEVVIQHCLIYKHNLNLKTWQLEKFPSNTKALHKLLETNIHSVPVIY
jgi:hypothetical protein